MIECVCLNCTWEGEQDDLTPCCGACPVCGHDVDDIDGSNIVVPGRDYPDPVTMSETDMKPL